jgi:hypothetical protein
MMEDKRQEHAMTARWRDLFFPEGTHPAVIAAVTEASLNDAARRGVSLQEMQCAVTRYENGTPMTLAGKIIDTCVARDAEREGGRTK